MLPQALLARERRAASARAALTPDEAQALEVAWSRAGEAGSPLSELQLLGPSGRAAYARLLELQERWAPATVWGGVELLRELGRGAHGVVFEAIGPRGHVALKVLTTLTPRASARFQREARVLHALAHPAIVRLLAVGERDGHPCLEMELLRDARPFGAQAARGLPRATLLSWAAQAADALAHAHAQGVVHRDVKPQNLLAVADGLRWVDFGLAFAAGEARLTRTSEGVGSLPYSAPEQLLSAHEPDPRADVFGLGAILFEVLCGAPAFPAQSVQAFFGAVSRPLQLPAELAPALGELLRRALAPTPAERPSAAELAQRLAAAVD